ncbi:MAG: Rrf2 family transcriptional regulator, partial [Bacillota bacterium]
GVEAFSQRNGPLRGFAGYHLSVDPAKITLFDIVESVEGSISPVSCVDDDFYCERADQCVTRDVWIRVRDAVKRELQAKTLAELADEQEKIDQSKNALS